MTIQSKAKEALNYLTTKTRDNGDKFVCQTDDSPEWMTDLCQEAHGDFLPDDYRYEFIRDVLSSLSEADDDDDANSLRDLIGEWADTDTEVHNGALAHWLASRLRRGEYVDQAQEDWGHSDGSIYGMLQRGQLYEREEVYNLVISNLEKLVEAEGDEA